MNITIKLSDIIDELDVMSLEVQSYLSLKTGKIVTISDYIGSEEDEANIEENSDNYILLPTQYDINEYSIMEDFIDEIDNNEIKSELYDAIRGKGAFRRFKDTVRYLNIESKWYEFKANALKKLAIKWCVDNNISYK